MDWILTPHFRNQLVKRKIPESFVEMALNNPDETVPGHKGRTVYHKIIKGKLLRVVTRRDTVITAYHTSKIKKYTKGE